ncbi:hypothetical protein ACVW1A_003276 [Bradyrhizobium sp. LB1.3]
MKRSLPLAMLLALGLAPAARAANEADYKTAYSAAEAASKEAASLRHQWTVTVLGAGRGQEGGRWRRFRPRRGRSQAGRGAGEGVDLPGHFRKRSLEGDGNPLDCSLVQQPCDH